MNTLDIQARLAARGIDPGPIDGIMGRLTRTAMQKFYEDRGHTIREDVHPSGLHRVVMHWTAGAYGDIALERRHYHVLIDQRGRQTLGDLMPEANANCSDGQYAAHTRALNTGSIGVSADAMAGAQERPFDPGPYPLTPLQVEGLCEAVADLCDTYRIPVSRWTVLSHAEVQPTLGVWQRRKWDIAWLPGMAGPGDPVKVGDNLRDMIRAAT